jgi:predicted transcriptional regulator
MLLKTYNFIKENLHLLEIDIENGLILNRKEYLNNSYKRVSIQDKDIEVHKIMGVILFDKQVVNKIINHIDGNKTNNQKSNLEVITQKENIRHAVKLGLLQPKLNNSMVREIKKLILEGTVNADIAKQFGVTESTIWSIKKGETWNHINVSSDFDYSKKPKKVNLTPEDIKNIHDLYSKGYVQWEIGEIYGCSQTTIGKIINKTHRFRNEGDFIVRKKFTTTLDDKLIKSLKLKAVQENTDVSKIIEKTLKEMLRNEQQQ